MNISYGELNAVYSKTLIVRNEMSHELVQMSQCRDVPGLRRRDERSDTTLIRSISFSVQTVWTGS